MCNLLQVREGIQLKFLKIISTKETAIADSYKTFPKIFKAVNTYSLLFEIA